MGGLCAGTKNVKNTSIPVGQPGSLPGQPAAPVIQPPPSAKIAVKQKKKENKILGLYEIKKYLCKGNGYKLKLGTQINNDTRVIIKMFDQQFGKSKEEAIINDISLNYIPIQNGCEHLVHILKTDRGTDYTDSVKDNKIIKVSYIVHEYCQNGLLFDWIRKINPLEENVARFYFK